MREGSSVSQKVKEAADKIAAIPAEKEKKGAAKSAKKSRREEDLEARG